MRTKIIFSLLLLLTLGVNRPAQAQSTVQFNNPQVEYSFGGMIHFEIDLQSEANPRSVWISIQAANNPSQVITDQATYHEGKLSYDFDLSSQPLNPFVEVKYWFRVEMQDGSIEESEASTFFYADNRFEWRSLETELLQAYWYEGDLEFGQDLLNYAHLGLQRLQQFIPVPPPNNVRLYAYASAHEMQTTLLLSGQNAAWIAGHSAPSQGVVIVSLPNSPEQSLEMRRQVPHELAHVALYQWLGESYWNLPQWLREGLPSIAELYANPDYPLLLNNAYQTESLLPIASLCQVFPRDASNFLLAYAEAASFSFFLHENYGNAGLEQLVWAYASGLSCEVGFEQALGLSLLQAERNWRRATFGENQAGAVFEAILPWLLVLSAILLPTFVLLISGRQRKRTINPGA